MVINIKTEKDILKQKKNLLIKHPNLNRFSVKPVREVFSDFRTIASFVDDSWQDTYQDQERFDYNEDYLNWVFGENGFNSEKSIVVKDQMGEICGVFMFTPRTINDDGSNIKTGIQTALSISPDAKGLGLAQLIHLESQLRGIADLDSHIYWYDSHVKANPPSHQIFTRLEEDYFVKHGKYPLMVRPLDYSRVVENANLNVFERLGLRVLSGHPKKVPVIEFIDSSNIEEVSNYLNDFNRIFSPDELSNYADFIGENTEFTSAGVALRKQGDIKGAAVGYTLDIIGKNQDTAFFLDQFCCDSIYKKELLEGIAHLAGSLGAMAILTIEPSVGILEKYAPAGSHLSCYSIPYTKEINTEGLVIDHK